jgi:hypothetical protein
MLPRLDDWRRVDSTRNRGDMFAEQSVAGMQGDAAPRIPWRIMWRRSMQRAQKTGEVGGGCVVIERW